MFLDIKMDCRHLSCRPCIQRSFHSPSHFIHPTAMRCLLLSIPKTPFFLSCSASLHTPSPPSSPIFQFLETDCAFSPPQISKIIKTNKSLRRVRSTQTARQAVEFLREWGFTHSQLQNIILRYPTLLSLRVDSQLKPMFDFLTRLGFSNHDLRILISRDPRLLGCSLEGNIKPRFPFLEQLFGSKASLTKGFIRAPQLLYMSYEKQLKPKIDVLKKWGIQGERLSLLLSISGSCLSRTGIEELEMRIEYVRNTLGVEEGSKTFVYVVHLLISMGPQKLEKKVRHLESLGLRKEEVQLLLRQQPLVFCISTEKMQRNMDFLTNRAGFQPNVVFSNTTLLHLSVENRLKPRLAVFQALCAMQQPTPNLSRILSSTEKKFLQNFVECGPYSSILNDIYKRKVKSTDVETT